MHKPSATFFQPLDGDQVGSRVTIRGCTQNIPSDSYLWIAHRRAKGGLIWPKEPKVNPDKNGDFSLNTFEGGAPGKLVISLLLVNGITNREFEQWIEKGHKTQNYQGINLDNYNGVELTNIEVTYNNKQPLRIFYSYSHDDEDLRKELEKHLVMMKRRNLIVEWHDRCIIAGEPLAHKIRTEIDRADIILLLISSSFMASDYCYQEEMARALERHKKGEARVVPIIVRAVEWKDSPIGHLLAIPTDGKPVKSWAQEDEAWVDVTHGIHKVIETMQ